MDDPLSDIELTPRQLQFCHEYAIDLNATQAAIRAGYREKGAHVQGSRLLSNPKISATISELQKRAAALAGITQRKVLQELAVVSFSDLRHFEIDENGFVSLADGAPDSAMRAVSSIKRKVRTLRPRDGDPYTEVETEIRLWDKPGTLRLAGQHLGLYIEKLEHSGRIEGTGVLAVPISAEDDATWAAGVAARQAMLARGNGHPNG